MDVAEPPRIVVVNPESCADAERVERVLRNALGSARAPRRAWTLAMRVQPVTGEATPTLRAEATIDDENGIQVADRALSAAAPGADCRGLARAVGVWASMVLEQEVAREHAPGAASSPPAHDVDPNDATWLAPAPATSTDEDPVPEPDTAPRHEGPPDIELGAAGFLMAGAGAGAMAGPAAYGIFESGRGVYLRPSLAVGEAIGALNAPSSLRALWLDARFDACLRTPGYYTKNRGLELDMCAGADVGFLDDATDAVHVPYVSVGPSIGLRGDLGGLLSATLRGVAGLNLTSETDGTIYQPLWSGRLELAFSWKVE